MRIHISRDYYYSTNYHYCPRNYCCPMNCYHCSMSCLRLQLVGEIVFNFNLLRLRGISYFYAFILLCASSGLSDASSSRVLGCCGNSDLTIQTHSVNFGSSFICYAGCLFALNNALILRICSGRCLQLIEMGRYRMCLL